MGCHDNDRAMYGNFSDDNEQLMQLPVEASHTLTMLAGAPEMRVVVPATVSLETKMKRNNHKIL